MEGKGDETVDTVAGDLVFVLQQKPHAKLRRSGGVLGIATKAHPVVWLYDVNQQQQWPWHMVRLHMKWQ